MSLFSTDLFRSFAIGFLIGTAAVISAVGMNAEVLAKIAG